MPIFYKSGYKYQLVKDYSIETVIVGSLMDLDFLKLTPNGVLTIRDGYAWDGPSGPVIDTPDTMRASLVHDAVYQLLRSGLDAKWKNAADELLYRLCIEDGMNILTATTPSKPDTIRTQSAKRRSLCRSNRDTASFPEDS